MTKKAKYIFDCAQFHSTRSEYSQLRNCTFVIESDDYVKIKAKALAHLMQQKPKEIAEHHYQDFTNLNVETDVVSYLNNPDGDS